MLAVLTTFCRIVVNIALSLTLVHCDVMMLKSLISLICWLLLKSSAAVDEKIISALWLGPAQYQIVEGLHPDAAVTGKFADDIANTG